LLRIGKAHHGIIPEKEFDFNTDKSGFYDSTQPAIPATNIDLPVDQSEKGGHRSRSLTNSGY